MKKKIRKEIYSRSFNGDSHDVTFADLPKDILDTDIINIQREQSYFSENESWGAFTELAVYRDVEETDEEYEQRILEDNEFKEELRKRRYQTYLSLKKEFEN